MRADPRLRSPETRVQVAKPGLYAVLAHRYCMATLTHLGKGARPDPSMSAFRSSTFPPPDKEPANEWWFGRPCSRPHLQRATGTLWIAGTLPSQRAPTHQGCA